MKSAKRVRKAPTNLSVRVDLVRKAKAAGINLSELLETALATEIKSVESARWLRENADAIARYNAHVEASGVFSDGWRRF
jgi:antitoxin CcdA